MHTLQRITQIAFIYILVYSCSTATLEYTDGITAIRTENNLARGEEQLKLATDIDSTNALPPYMLGRLVYYKQERWEEMNNAFIKAESRNPSLSLNQESFAVEDRIINSVGEAIKLLRQDAVYKIIKEYFADKANYDSTIAERVKELKVVGTTDEIIKTLLNEDFKLKDSLQSLKEKLRLAISILPDNAEAYCELSDLYVSDLDNAMALQILNDGIASNPNNWVLQYKLAEFYESDGSLDKALEACRQSIASDAPPEVYSLLFRLYFDLGEIEKAKEACETLIDKFQDNPQFLSSAFYNKAILYRKIGSEYFDSAQKKFFSEDAINNKEVILADLENALDNLKIAKTNFEDYKYTSENPDQNIDILIKETRSYIYKIEREWLDRVEDLGG